MGSRTCIAVVLALVAVVGGPAIAHAERAGAVALLPLDAEARLEIYGQPVASELARALVAGAIDVVVVGPRMAVPDRVRLIVDGKIASGKGSTVVLSLRVRRQRDGTTIEELQATAPTIASIDRAAAELAGRLLPIIRDQLAAAATQPAPEPVGPPVAIDPPSPAAPRAILVAVGVGGSATVAVEPLRIALGDAVPGWAQVHRRSATAVEPGALARATASQTVAASAADRAILFEILGYRVDAGEVPLARARVRVRIADGTRVVFERVVITDSVVGDRRMPPDRLAARVAREVLSILRPHLRRAVAGWP